MKMMLFAGLMMLSLAAMAADAPFVDTSVEPSDRGLYPVRNGNFDAVYAKPGVDLRGYESFVLDDVQITYKAGRKGRKSGSRRFERSELNDEETLEMQAIFDEVFRAQLSEDEGYAIAYGPGAATMRLSPYILDLVINVPLDPTPGRSRVYVDSVAEMTLAVELRDSMSGELLAVVADRRSARNLSQLQKTTRVTSRTEVRRLLTRWAQLLREGLDSVRSTEIETR